MTRFSFNDKDISPRSMSEDRARVVGRKRVGGNKAAAAKLGISGCVDVLVERISETIDINGTGEMEHLVMDLAKNQNISGSEGVNDQLLILLEDYEEAEGLLGSTLKVRKSAMSMIRASLVKALEIEIEELEREGNFS